MRSSFQLTLKNMPFVRLFIFLLAGILIEWYLQFSLASLLISFFAIIFFLVLFLSFSSAIKFSLRWLQGALTLILFAFAGAMIIYIKDIRHHSNSVTQYYKNGEIIKATLLEPLVEKPKSYKALAAVNSIYIDDKWQNVEGKILIYFKRDSAALHLSYGSQIIFDKPLQTIENAGNPGEFDYKRYSLFQGVQQQVFLTNDYVLLPQKRTNNFQSFIYHSRDYIISTLRKNIHDKKTQSVAEALLIGYRDDVDKNLLQAYSNTGVVHIIVISGLHMGMIYGLALWLISPFKRKKSYKIIRASFSLLVIWFFAFVTGARPSILRVATVLSFIIIGEVINRKPNVYNTLAASAFLLLCINPFYLWDGGFQLSFAAVTSIVTFYKPIYNAVFIQNKLLKKVWQLGAVTIAVQIFTLPLVLYHFHRLPVFFLFTNFIAVPLAWIALYLEIFLLVISKWNWLAAIVGKAITACISVMNNFIENTNRLPHAIINNVYTDIFQTIILFIIIISFSVWLMEKSARFLLIGMTALCIFIAVKIITLMMDEKQNKLIVYNISKNNFVDVVQGRNFKNIKNTSAETQSLQVFYLIPSRIYFHANDYSDSISLLIKNNLIQSTHKNIFIIDRSFHAKNFTEKIAVDAIIISQNPYIKMNVIQNIFNCSEIVFDSSNPLWKIAMWAKQCDSLHLRFHSVPQQGAFVMDL